MWITLSNCLRRVRETSRRLFAQVPGLSTFLGRTTLIPVPRHSRENHSPKYANLPVVHPVIYSNDSRGEQSSENVQTRGFPGRHPAEESIYCLSTLNANANEPFVYPKTSVPMSGHQRNNAGLFLYVTANSGVHASRDQVSTSAGSWPGCSDGSKTEKEKPPLANQPLEGPKHNRSNDDSISRLQPSNRWRYGWVLGGKGYKPFLKNDPGAEEEKKQETSKLKTDLKGKSTSDGRKAQSVFPSPISFPGAKTGLYAVVAFEDQQHHP